MSKLSGYNPRRARSIPRYTIISLIMFSGQILYSENLFQEVAFGPGNQFAVATAVPTFVNRLIAYARVIYGEVTYDDPLLL